MGLLLAQAACHVGHERPQCVRAALLGQVDRPRARSRLRRPRRPAPPGRARGARCRSRPGAAGRCAGCAGPARRPGRPAGAGAGGAGHADQVHEPPGLLAGQLDPRVGAGGGQQRHQVEPVFAAGLRADGPASSAGMSGTIRPSARRPRRRRRTRLRRGHHRAGVGHRYQRHARERGPRPSPRSPAARSCRRPATAGPPAGRWARRPAGRRRDADLERVAPPSTAAAASWTVSGSAIR